jgi:Holliday junction resolvase RusA-like endonuclease
MNDKFTIYIPGKPRSKGNSGRILKRGRRRFIAPSEVSVVAEASAADHARAQWHIPPLEGPVRLDVIFQFALPKKPKGREVAGDWCLRKIDRGNLLKLIEDALKGIVYADDSQVVAGDVSKIWGAEDGTFIAIEHEPAR